MRALSFFLGAYPVLPIRAHVRHVFLTAIIKTKIKSVRTQNHEKFSTVNTNLISKLGIYNKHATVLLRLI